VFWSLDSQVTMDFNTEWSFMTWIIWGYPQFRTPPCFATLWCHQTWQAMGVFSDKWRFEWENYRTKWVMLPVFLFRLDDFLILSIHVSRIAAHVIWKLQVAFFGASWHGILWC
jgi:hypothetical protein